MINPKREVSYDGCTYKVRSNKIEIPDFDQMERMAVLVWLNRNTYPIGVGIRTRPNPLQGIGGAISVKTK